MNEPDDRMLRALLAQSAEPAEDSFVQAVMARVERERRATRTANVLAVVCALMIAAALAPWVARLVLRGTDLLQQLFVQASSPTPLLLAASGLTVLLVAGFAAWASRS